MRSRRIFGRRSWWRRQDPERRAQVWLLAGIAAIVGLGQFLHRMGWTL